MEFYLEFQEILELTLLEKTWVVNLMQDEGNLFIVNELFTSAITKSIFNNIHPRYWLQVYLKLIVERMQYPPWNI